MQHSLWTTAWLTAVMITVSGQGVLAEDKCQEFSGINPAVFDTALGGYVGPTFAVLGDEVLVDTGTPRPPVRPPTTTCKGSVCIDRDAQYLYDFGNGDTLTIEVLIAVYKEPPTYGHYRATNKIVAGTGRFKNATGTILDSGPFIAWVDANGQFRAIYNGELSGRICNVEPAGK